VNQVLERDVGLQEPVEKHESGRAGLRQPRRHVGHGAEKRRDLHGDREAYLPRDRQDKIDIALLDLGAGIDPAFTGRENALLLGVLAGATRRQMYGALDAVQAFSGLGTAFEQPVRTYSQGMTLRLAFAAAAHADPELLLIDEVLAVGDAFFQQRCLMRIRELQQKGCTVLVVTHDTGAVFGFCDEAIWLSGGQVALSGPPEQVVSRYLAAEAAPAPLPRSETFLLGVQPGRQRPPGKALAGRWEFPGGKLHDGEQPYVALVRELREELGVETHAASPLMRYPVEYPGRVIWLDMWIVTEWSGNPSGRDGQALKWVEPSRLPQEDIQLVYR
jgi:mutator protein MutT